MTVTAPPSAEIEKLTVLFRDQRYTEAAALARVMTENCACHAAGWKALGLALYLSGRTEEALLPLRQATILAPGDAPAHNNLAGVYRELGHYTEAVASCRRALAIRPDYAEAHNNLGRSLQDLGELDTAVASYRQALQIRPGSANALSNLGTAWAVMGRHKDAAQCYQRALQIEPNLVQAHFNLGNAQRELGQLDEAEASYRRSLAIQEGFLGAHVNLGHLLTGLGRLDDSTASFRRALEIRPDYIDGQSSLLFAQNLHSDMPVTKMLTDARQYGRLVASKVEFRFTDWICPRSPGRLRVGLVSGDLRSHPVGHFLESLIFNADPAKIDLHAYPTSPAADQLTARFKPHFSAWKLLVGKSDAEAARLIHDDGIHVLLDLAGHTSGNRLPVLAWKPAPVQVSWLGYFATTGVAEIDYVLADPYAVLPDEDAHFTEEVWRLPDTRLCFSPPHVQQDVGPLPAQREGCVTFGCFNNLAKMNDEVVALWSRVLLAVPGSRLFLKCKQLNTARVQDLTMQRFNQHGIASDRLLFEGESPRADYFGAYRRVDIALDPFPYPGGTTTVEGLWMGVPVITRRGDRFLSHQGECFARNAGLSEWIAEDDDDYIAKAVLHTSDLQRLAKLRAVLRAQVLASPLFDGPRFARHFEAAVWGMWSRWLNHSSGT